MTFAPPFELLTRVSIDAIKNGLPASVVGTIVARTDKTTEKPVFYDVLLPVGCVACAFHRFGDPRVAVSVPAEMVTFADDAVREIDFPMTRAGWSLHVGATA